MITVFTETAPKQLSKSLPEVVPEVTACMWDTKKQVKTSSTTAMRKACDIIGNKDIEHMSEKVSESGRREWQTRVADSIAWFGDTKQTHCG
jgi:hypothetical protein